MSEDTNGGPRTHEPNLRELTAQLDDLKELMLVRFEANDRIRLETNARYEQRFASSDTAVAAALSAQKEATAAAFAASEKAIVKAEISQENYNTRSNEFRAALDDSNKDKVSRAEADVRFKALEDKQVSVGRTLEDKIEANKSAREFADKELREQVGNLQLSRSELLGAAVQNKDAHAQNNWTADFGLRLIGLLIVALEAYRIFVGK